MTQTGEMNLNLTKFFNKYLFRINFAIMVATILYVSRRDWQWHPVVVSLLILSFVFPVIETGEKRLLHAVGKFNSTFLLICFYFLFFTPFSFIYRAFFKNKAFELRNTGLIEKTEISPFDRPF